MIQIKCGNCNMVCNIDEKYFNEQRAAKTKKVTNRLKCASCGTDVLPAVLDIIYDILDADLKGWEIRMFPFNEKVILMYPHELDKDCLEP